MGREVKDYDVVVAKGTGRNVIGMDVGICLGKSVVSERSRRSVSDIFLVVNPSADELAIKEKILSNIKQSERDKEEKARIKTIPLSKMEVGGLYEDINDSKFIFLGRCEYKKCKKGYLHDPVEQKSGYGFLWYHENGLTEDGANVLIKHSLQYGRSFSFLKGNKRIKKKIGQVNLRNKYENEHTKHFYDSTIYVSTLQLLDLCK